GRPNRYLPRDSSKAFRQARRRGADAVSLQMANALGKAIPSREQLHPRRDRVACRIRIGGRIQPGLQPPCGYSAWDVAPDETTGACDDEIGRNPAKEEELRIA